MCSEASHPWSLGFYCPLSWMRGQWWFFFFFFFPPKKHVAALMLAPVSPVPVWGPTSIPDDQCLGGLWRQIFYLVAGPLKSFHDVLQRWFLGDWVPSPIQWYSVAETTASFLAPLPSQVGCLVPQRWPLLHTLDHRMLLSVPWKLPAHLGC